MTHTTFSYAIVIVTYNRIKMLKKCLEHALGQSAAPSALVIVDNCSTDGTAEYLDELVHNPTNDIPILLYHEPDNVGGAGGFHDGLKIAVEQTKAKWFLLIDDDAILDFDCMEKMDPAKARHRAAIYACSVYCRGELELPHRQNRRGVIPEEKYKKNEFLCTRTTFCGSMYARKLVQKIGYPLKEYFLWFDDTEYSLRAAKYTPVVVRTAATLQHGDPDQPDRRAVADWRYYYGTRNQLDMLRRHHRVGRLLTFRVESALMVLLRYLRMVRHLGNKELFEQNKKEAAIFRDGRRDGLRGRLGKNERYLPGI